MGNALSADGKPCSTYGKQHSKTTITCSMCSVVNCLGHLKVHNLTENIKVAFCPVCHEVLVNLSTMYGEVATSRAQITLAYLVFSSL